MSARGRPDAALPFPGAADSAERGTAAGRGRSSVLGPPPEAPRLQGAPAAVRPLPRAAAVGSVCVPRSGRSRVGTGCEGGAWGLRAVLTQRSVQY